MKMENTNILKIDIEENSGQKLRYFSLLIRVLLIFCKGSVCLSPFILMIVSVRSKGDQTAMRSYVMQTATHTKFILDFQLSMQVMLITL